jgi:hypothetical protein
MVVPTAMAVAAIVAFAKTMLEKRKLLLENKKLQLEIAAVTQHIVLPTDAQIQQYSFKHRWTATTIRVGGLLLAIAIPTSLVMRTVSDNGSLLIPAPPITTGSGDVGIENRRLIVALQEQARTAREEADGARQAAAAAQIAMGEAQRERQQAQETAQRAAEEQRRAEAATKAALAELEALRAQQLPTRPPAPAPSSPIAATPPMVEAPRASSPTAGPRSDFSELLSRYGTAIESHNSDALLSVWPAAPVAELRRVWRNIRAETVSLTNCATMMQPELQSAVTTCDEMRIVQPIKGETLRLGSRIQFDLRLRGDTWVIASVRNIGVP